MIGKILGWAGFRQWQFWAAGIAGVIILGLAAQNAVLGHELNAADAQMDVVEGKLDTALNANEELVSTINRVKMGYAIDETAVAQNQAEIDRLRRESDERQNAVNRQESGPASDAIVCAITRVCD